MEVLRDTKLLKFHTNTLELVRGEIGLNKKGRIDEALDIIENWVEKQPHFTKKKFNRELLERSLVINKGLVERTKARIDKLCTLKTLMPEFYTCTDPEKEFGDLDKIVCTAHLPRLTPDQSRVHIIKMISDNIDSAMPFKHYKYLVFKCEYMNRFDYCKNYTMIIDCTQLHSCLSLVTKTNPLLLRQIVTLVTTLVQLWKENHIIDQRVIIIEHYNPAKAKRYNVLLSEGYGARIKAIHLISESKTIEALSGLLKQVFSSKVAGRFHVHKTIDSVYDHVPRDILPVDYGGKEKTLKDLNSDWLQELTSPEFLDYFREMGQARTNEAYRPADQFSYLYANVPGSFRALSVD